MKKSTERVKNGKGEWWIDIYLLGNKVSGFWASDEEGIRSKARNYRQNSIKKKLRRGLAPDPIIIKMHDFRIREIHFIASQHATNQMTMALHQVGTKEAKKRHTLIFCPKPLDRNEQKYA